MIQEIRVRGIVQGVGFRPTVYRLAQAWGLRGEVLNDGEGVLIRVVGNRETIGGFLEQLQRDCPPLAQIKTIVSSNLANIPEFTDFTIAPSQQTPIHTNISADAATCELCQADIFNPLSRWYHYPFTICTHCGPRLSIIQSLPYDRLHTSMAVFPLCGECRREYEDVKSRRFHAQPIACPHCGPGVWLEKGNQVIPNTIPSVCNLLKNGEIVAIKGLGGFHLACNATLEITVQRLRQKKHRDHKPLALMGKNSEMIAQYCHLSPEEIALLNHPAAPIVLLHKKDTLSIAESVAPHLNYWGFMVPYTPLHHLILENLDFPIVLTSGNDADEPQCITNEEAKEQLGDITQYFLLHNRAIINRLDDSVARIVDKKPYLLRRARGYAPTPLSLPPGFENSPRVLAMGGELKNTFCLLRPGEAILSQHLGDLENTATNISYQQTLNLYLNLFAHQPQIIARDLHPNYLASKLGEAIADNHNLILESIQHHHAHICAVMAENQLPLNHQPLLGIALDGLGYGDDGSLWGGEFLLADYRSFQRLAHWQSVALLGGKQAIYQPWRNTYAHLRRLDTWEQLQKDYADLDIMQFLQGCPQKSLEQMLAKGINSPLASSAGRLFDAVAAALGICREKASYEGQAAIYLEAIAAEYLQSSTVEGYTFDWEQSATLILKADSLWLELLTDLQKGKDLGYIAASFHLGLATAITRTVITLQEKYPFTEVVLTGGVFQNLLLLTQVKERLNEYGFTLLTPSLVPANDGGLSLGQGIIAAARNL